LRMNSVLILLPALLLYVECINFTVLDKGTELFGIVSFSHGEIGDNPPVGQTPSFERVCTIGERDHRFTILFLPYSNKICAIYLYQIYLFPTLIYSLIITHYHEKKRAFPNLF
jgi:hypothetical protein